MFYFSVVLSSSSLPVSIAFARIFRVQCCTVLDRHFRAWCRLVRLPDIARNPGIPFLCGTEKIDNLLLFSSPPRVVVQSLLLYGVAVVFADIKGSLFNYPSAWMFTIQDQRMDIIYYSLPYYIGHLDFPRRATRRYKSWLWYMQWDRCIV